MSDVKVTTWADVRMTLAPGVANLKVDDVLDQQIIITAVHPTETSFGPAMRFTCLLEGKELEVLTHSQVLLKQLSAVADKLPMQATIAKTGRSFSLS
jgi:hypothetical protein